MKESIIPKYIYTHMEGTFISPKDNGAQCGFYCLCVCVSVCVSVGGWTTFLSKRSAICRTRLMSRLGSGRMQEVSHADSFIHRETDNKLAASYVQSLFRDWKRGLHLRRPQPPGGWAELSSLCRQMVHSSDRCELSKCCFALRVFFFWGYIWKTCINRSIVHLFGQWLPENENVRCVVCCRRGEKHPSVPRTQQDEGLLLHCQPGPRGGLQDQDHRKVTLVCSHISTKSLFHLKKNKITFWNRSIIISWFWWYCMYIIFFRLIHLPYPVLLLAILIPQSTGFFLLCCPS